MSRSQAVSQTTVTEAPFFDDGTSTTIESELKADTKDHKKKKFNGWQIFGISIGAIFGFFFLWILLGALRRTCKDETFDEYTFQPANN